MFFLNTQLKHYLFLYKRQISQSYYIHLSFDIKLHIVYVTGYFAEREKDILSGMEIYIYKTAKNMIMHGHEVTILAVGHCDKEWTYDGIPVVSRQVNRSIGMGIFNVTLNEYVIYPIIREFVFNHALNEINKKKKITLVQYAGWLGVGMLYSGRYPSVLRLSTYAKEQLYANYTEKEIQMITWCEQMAAKRFDGIIAPSNALGKPYSKDTGRKVTIIKTPYRSDNLEQEDFSIYDEKLKGKKYYLYFGRITQDKGVETIAHAIYNILSNHKDIYFVMAGAIPVSKNKNLLKEVYDAAKAYKNRILYLGAISHNQLKPFISIASNPALGRLSIKEGSSIP